MKQTKKAESSLHEVLKWIIVVIAIVVIILLIFQVFQKGEFVVKIECEKLGGFCVGNEKECIGTDEIVQKGLGCEEYCCLKDDNLLR